MAYIFATGHFLFRQLDIHFEKNNTLKKCKLLLDHFIYLSQTCSVLFSGHYQK